ncbi:hypothetical protein [Candidatus Paracaedibacter symbiosus]|uniref:hypothetical protein n=1 Tax=Candidatus Paracaedibacter symbiosus TaxID=244582 RepID=UPI00050947A7|nr:hypothetical protein [Candidatus Paracaedibacter symbiosus]
MNSPGLARSNPDHTLCGKYIEKVSKETNVPPEVIWAVASAESNLGKLGPWPWSVNIRGKAFYFKSQKEMITFIHKKLKKNPHISMDIGCMQLNYLYHGHKFSNIHEMSNIYENMLVGARYLRQLFEANQHTHAHKKLTKNRLWGYAVGDYHSQQSSRGAQYIRRTSKFLMTTPAWYDDIFPEPDFP